MWCGKCLSDLWTSSILLGSNSKLPSAQILSWKSVSLIFSKICLLVHRHVTKNMFLEQWTVFGKTSVVISDALNSVKTSTYCRGLLSVLQVYFGIWKLWARGMYFINIFFSIIYIILHWSFLRMHFIIVSLFDVFFFCIIPQ